jgi:hypothetical protein
MKDIRIDSQGRQRCWNCGGTGFTEKRTTRSKLLVGVGTFLTKKKLQCQSCGEYNETGNSKSYDGPASERAAKKLGTAAIDEQGAAPKEMSDSAPVYPNCERPKANAAPEKRTVSALLGVGILFLPFIFSWFTLRKGHSVLARTLSFSWLVWSVVIMTGAQDGTENRVASTSGNASTEARQVNSKSNEAAPDLEVKLSRNSGGGVFVSGKTSLPDAMNLMISLRAKSGGLLAQDKVQVRSGTFESAGFTSKGSALPAGEYRISIISPLMGLQPISVKQKLGSSGSGIPKDIREKTSWGEHYTVTYSVSRSVK